MIIMLPTKPRERYEAFETSYKQACHPLGIIQGVASMSIVLKVMYEDSLLF